MLQRNDGNAIARFGASRSRIQIAGAHGIACVSNMKQLQLAWLLYADDNNGKYAPNPSSDSGSVNAVDP